jgi:putative transposase
VIPKYGAVRLAKELRFPGNIQNVTISEQGGQWFASFQVELSEDYVYPHRCETQAVVGIDLGLNAHLTLVSNDLEDKVPNPKFYRRFERKLKQAQRALSRKQKGSRNREKAKQLLANCHQRLARHRANHLHHTTAKIVEMFRWIGVEDLAVANLMKNHSLARALADASFGEIRRQLTYKAEWAGGHVAVADRFFASSKICSTCGHKHSVLKLQDRTWTCPVCGATHDRDVNAARNLEKVARGLRDTQNACVTAQPEQRSRRKSRWSKDPRAPVKIQETLKSFQRE